MFQTPEQTRKPDGENIAVSTEIRVAIIDAFFCPKAFYKKHYPFIKVVFLSKESESTQNCSSENLNSPALHGHHVLENIFGNFSTKSMENKITVYLGTVFNRIGLQHTPFWKSHIKKVNQLKPHFTVLAVGYFKDNQLDSYKFNHPLLLASGNVGRGIDKTTEVFPHKNKLDNYFLIGSAINSAQNSTILGTKSPQKGLKGKPMLWDSTLLYENKIDYFLPHEGTRNQLRYSSFSVASFANKILKKCSSFKKEPSTATLKKCIKSLETQIIFHSPNKSSGKTI